mgnify:CR=1 FL=1|tara:strand:- start:81782 stop:82000 length:219 start_codon:yes stop_codon:yes gene_type:complete
MTKTKNTDNIKAIMATCPACQEETNVNTTNPHRPFCSERCKLIDLGNWASGTYAIPVSEQNQSEDYDPDSHS